MKLAPARVFAAVLLLAGAVFAQSPPKLRPKTFSLTEADRGYWAFQPVRPQPIPRIAGARHPIDAFLAAKLTEQRLKPNSAATPRELVRRAYFDLIGLPPAPEAVREFEADPSNRAWEKLVDGLLSSPRYGERWGRHWLDLVRYAESNGYERDGPKPNAWRYRDYVIRSFNQDKPYDRFVLEQLAGDELEIEEGSSEWRDAIIATGFLRLHVWDDEPDSTLAAEFDDLDDVVVTTSTAFLGLTVGCARCHNHKFDPISQADYYSFLSFFRGVDPYGLAHKGGGGRGVGKIERLLAPAPELERWTEQRDARVRELERKFAQAKEKQIEDALKAAREMRPPFPSALAAVENGPEPKPTHVLARGDPNSPRAEVRPAFPVVFGFGEPRIRAGRNTSGRRRTLGNWIVSTNNPLTARVMANRLWQHHFGSALVPTPDDFGRAGIPPVQTELLDFLAAEVMAGGWHLKRMHKFIMTSEAYRMSSRADQKEGVARDEANTLFWRQNLRRMEAEVIRDTILSASGQLNLKTEGPSVYPTLPREVHGTQDASGKGWTDSPEREQNRRSVYLAVKRGLKIPLLECFDFANSSSPSGVRPITTSAPQALMLLNDEFVRKAARALQNRIEIEAGSDTEALIARAFSIVLQRNPEAREKESALRFIKEQGLDAGRTDAIASFCEALLNLNEAIYAD